jgi:glycosyltransferase involved in cell wall biosynthesis
MKSSKKPTISGFFPFLNDWGTIGSLVTALDVVLQEAASDYEIIIIDDGSDERSKEILKMLKKKFSKVKIITHEKNQGYGGAIKDGIKNSKMDWIFYTDGDAQYDPRDLRILIKNQNKKTDIINGYKIKRSDPWFRKLTGKSYHFFVKTLFNVPIRDTDCDFRLMKRSIFDKVKLESNSGLICAEMIKKISDSGFKFQEVPVHHYWRTSGKSQFFNIRRVSKVVFGLLVLWYKLVIRKEHLKNAASETDKLQPARA